MTITNRLLKKQHWPLFLALVLGFVHGLIYVVIIPPWQHYDEPNHFEVAWLIAARNRIPVSGDYDQEMRRETAKSMIEHGFYKGYSSLPDLTQQDQPISIGAQSQLDEPPLYYLLAAIPLKLTHNFPITTQLYMVRLLSLVLYLISILAAYGTMINLTSPYHPLRWMVPVGMALLPGFTDLMTSVNNDVVAVAVFSLFIWGCIASIRSGLNVVRFIWIVGTTVLCLLSKETAYFAVLLLPFAIIFSIFRSGRWLRFGWVITLFIVVIGALVCFSWGDAALWYRRTNQTLPTRSASTDAPIGQYVFQIEESSEETKLIQGEIYQLLPPAESEKLGGKQVTLGAWMWANQPDQQVTLVLMAMDSAGRYYKGSHTFVIGETPIFYAFQASMPEAAANGWVYISPSAQDADPVTFYFDGITFAEGNFPIDDAPKFYQEAGITGQWAGQDFTNLIRNASAEDSWPRFRSWIDILGAKILPDNGRPSIILYSLLDWSVGGWYYKMTAQNLLYTFWGKFGWGHVPLLGSKTYQILFGTTILGMGGTLLSFGQEGKRVPWKELVFLGVSTIFIWMFTWARGALYLFGRAFIPSARYAFPVIISTMGFLCLGWWSISHRLGNWFSILSKVWLWIFGIFFISLDVWSLISILTYYYR
jgi:hypothetical protein